MLIILEIIIDKTSLLNKLQENICQEFRVEFMTKLNFKTSASDILLNQLPTQPGVYIYFDISGKIIYVGAASNLKKRISSYFRKDIPDPKTYRLVNKIDKLDYEIHLTIEKAFLRERELIRIHHPRFNFDWKDDKEYPMIQITKPDKEEKFSRIFIVRSVTKQDDWYFSRKKDVKALRYSVRALRSIFPIANKPYCFKTKRFCLDYSINRCTAPCVNKISLEEYQKIIDQLILFLKGKKEDLIINLHQEMIQLAEELNFEKAAKLRDRIHRIEATLDHYPNIPEPRDKDYVILIENQNFYAILIIWVLNNQIINVESIDLGKIKVLAKNEILRSFLYNYYINTEFIPQRIEIDTDLQEDQDILEIWLSKRQGTSVHLKLDLDLKDRDLIKPYIFQIINDISENIQLEHKKDALLEDALLQIQDLLQLNKKPLRIETYDVSNLQGSFPVGSMVVFEGGLPVKSEYRRFKIKNLASEPNDVAMIKDILERRLKHKGLKFAKKDPDLIVVDGGKPQVNTASRVLKQLSKEIPLIGLAKREEQIFLPYRKKPLEISAENTGLKLLKQCRDEAHRFAVDYHIKRRLSQPKSELDSIPGIGPKKRNALLQYFQSLENIKNSTIEELSQVEGINQKLAEKIYLFFKTKYSKELSS